MKKLGTILIPLFLALGLALHLPARAGAEVRALFVNVGKADAAIFWLDDACYLVDTGHKNSYDQLYRVLEACSIRHLDGVIVTHTDKDHAGGLKKLLKSGIVIDALYAGAFVCDADANDHPVQSAARKSQLAVTWLAAGDRIEASANCAFEVLGPLRRDPDVENNNSLVLRLVTPQGEMLLAADMEREEEADLMEAGLLRPSTVLKVAHHGEDDSTSKRFALLVCPEWAIVSTSTAEEADTPDPKILSRLRSVGSSIAVTQDAQVGIQVSLVDGHAVVERIDWE